MVPSPTKSPRLPTSPVPAGGDTLVHELTRLRNELRLKDSQLEEKLVEIQTLKNNIYKKDEALEKSDKELGDMREQVMSGESEILSLRRQLTTTESERDQLRRETDAVSRQADSLTERLQHTLRKGSEDGGTHVEDVARLSNLLHELKLENQKLAEDNKGCYNVIRAKDKEMDELLATAAKADQALLEAKTKENVIADLRRQLNDLRAELTDGHRMQRLKAQEVADVQMQAERTAKELATTSEYLSSVMAELAVAQEKLQETRVENKDLKAQLERAGLAAERSRREAAAIPRESTISVMQHLEEVKYMQGEIHRLKQRLQHAEAEAKSARTQRERLFRRIDSLAASSSAMASARLASGSAGDLDADADVAGPNAAADAGSPTAVAEGEIKDIAVGSPQELIAALRAELEETREMLGMKEEEVSTLGKQNETCVRRAGRFKLDALKVRHVAFKALGPEAYASAFGEREPPPVDEAGAAVLEREEAEAAREAAQAAGLSAALERVLEQLARKEQEIKGLRALRGAAVSVAHGVGPGAVASDDAAVSVAHDVDRANASTGGTAAGVAGASAASAGAVGSAVAIGSAFADGHLPTGAAAGGKAGATGAGDELTSVSMATQHSARQHEQQLIDQVESAQASLRQAAEAIGQKSMELAQAQEQVAALQRRVRELEAHAAELEAQLEDSDSEEESDVGLAPSPLLQATIDAAEARRRNRERQEGGSIFFGERDDPLHAPMTKDRLAVVLEKLVQQRAASKKAPVGSPESKDDGQLFDEATAMLKAELARLGQETVKKMEENEKLRSEVGELKTARFTAEAMATRLEEMNALSMQVAGLKMELAKARAYIEELSSSRGNKKARNPMRKLRKTFSKGLQSLMPDVTEQPLPSPGARPAPSPAGRPPVATPPHTTPSPRPVAGGVQEPASTEKRSWGERLNFLTPRRSSSGNLPSPTR